MDMKSVLTTLDIINKPKSADIIAEDEIEEELTLEELEALEEEDELEEAMVSVDDFDDRPASDYKLTSRSEEKTAGGTLRKSEYEREDGEFTEKQIKMAFGILNDPRYKGGNLTDAIEAIEGIAPGLSEHPAVQRAMLATSESIELSEFSKENEKAADKEPIPQKDMGIYGAGKKKKDVVKDDNNELATIAKLAGIEEGFSLWSKDDDDDEGGLFGGYKTRQDQLDAQEAEAMGLAKPKKKDEDEVEEGYDMDAHADPELDYEGDMAKNQLARIMLHAEHLSSMLEDNENMPEWVQSKITKALDYIATAHDYLMGEEYKD
jgi:hypothetical protein